MAYTANVWEESISFSIDHGQEPTVTDSMIDQVDPLMAKGELAQYADEILPIQAVVGFQHVQLESNVPLFFVCGPVPQSSHKQNLIRNFAASHETALFQRGYFREDAR